MEEGSGNSTRYGNRVLKVCGFNETRKLNLKKNKISF